MTSPFADASVEVIADFSRFDEEFGRGLRARIKAAATGAGKEFDQLGTAAKRAGDTVSRNMRTAGESVRTSFSGGAREAVKDFGGISDAARRVSVSVTAEMRRAAVSTRTSFAGVSDSGSRVFATIGASARAASRDIQAAFNPGAMRILFDPLVTGARNAVTQVQATLGGPAMRRVFDGITDAGRLASVRLSTDLPAAAVTVRDAFTATLGTGPDSPRGRLTAIGAQATTAGGTIRAAFAGLGDTIRSTFAGVSTGGFFGDITTGSTATTTEVDDDFSRMADRVINHFQAIGRQSLTTSAEIIAAFKTAGAGSEESFRFGNPFQLLVLRAFAAGEGIRRAMQLAAVSSRASLAQVGANASRDFGRISDAARTSGLRIGASMRAAGRNLREAFASPRNPFTLLVKQATDAAGNLIDKFRGTGRQVEADLQPETDPFDLLADLAREAAANIRRHFRLIRDDIARDLSLASDPFDGIVDDARRAADQIRDQFRTAGRFIAGDLGAGVEDPFNVITRRAGEASRDITAKFRGAGREISNDVNPPGNPFDGLVRQSAAAQRDVSENMREAGASITRTMVAAAGVSALAGGVSVLSGGLAGLAVSAAAVTAALAPMAGALLGLPAVLGAVGIGVGALSVGMDGMDKIFASLSKDKPKDFEKALAKLSPAARAFALELKRLEPAFNAMKAGVQDTLFAGLVPVLRSISGNLLPVLRDGLSAMTSVFNTVGKALGKFLADPKTASILRDIFADAATAAGALAEAVVPASKALLGLVAAGGPGVRALADGIRSMAEGFAEFVRKGTESGQITKIIQKGMDVAVQFGRILGDLGGILLGVFKAAGSGSDSVLGGIEKVTSSLNNMANSAKGQSVIGNVFKDMRALAAAVLPVFKELAVGIATKVLPIIKEIGIGLGPGLADGLKALGEGFNQFLEPIKDPENSKRFTTLAQQIGKGIGDISRELGNVLKESGPAIADALREFPATVKTVVEGLKSLARVVKELRPVVRPLVAAMAALLDVFAALSSVLTEVLIPALKILVAALRPALNFIADKLDDLQVQLKTLVKPVRDFGEEFSHFFIDLVPFGVELIVADLKELGKWFTDKIPDWLKKAGKAINDFFSIDTPKVFSRFTGTFQVMLSNIVKAVDVDGAKITGWFTALPGAILRAVTGLDVSISQKFTDMLAGVFRVLTTGAGFQVTGWFAALPGLILKSVTGLDVPVVQKFTDLMAGILRTVTDRGAAVLAWFADLPGKIGVSLAGLSDRLARDMNSAIGSMLLAAITSSRALFAWFVALPGVLYNALFKVPGFMRVLGNAIIEGLAAGIVETSRKLIPKTMRDIAESIPWWLRQFLEIRSPSRVMWSLGEQAMDGVRGGLLSGLDSIKAVMAELAATIAQDMGTPVIGAPVMPSPVITPAAVAAAAAVVPVAVPVTPVVPVQRAAPVVAPGGLAPAALTGAGSGLTVVNNITLPTGDPQAAAQATVNRIAASVLAGGA